MANESTTAFINSLKTTAKSTESKILLRLLASQGDVNLGDVILEVDDLEELLKGIGGNVETPGASRVINTTGTVLAGAFGVSISNVGDLDCTVLGATIKPGETFTYEPKVGNTLGAIAWIANAGATAELVILEIR